MKEVLQLDQSDLSNDDLQDFVEIYEEMNAVAVQRKPQIDLLQEPYRRSKIAWKVAIFSNAMTHRFVALAEGVALSWNSRNTLSAVLNARAMIETVAIYYEFGGCFQANFGLLTSDPLTPCQ
jgi:hypothetical protein